MTVVFYISGHGFGHASRQIEVIRALKRREPALRVIVRSQVPAWFFDVSGAGEIELQTVETDVGVVQHDSLRLDEVESAARAEAFYSTFDRRVDTEVRLLDDTDAAVVVGDVPPLAFAAARAARRPSILISNFTWDWIYRAYPIFHSRGARALETIEGAYSEATRALRLPMHGGFETIRTVSDIPLIARRSTLDPRNTRTQLDLPADATLVLASFGAYGLRLPYEEIACRSDAVIVLTAHDTPDAVVEQPRLRVLRHRTLNALGLRYDDLVAACDIVVTKPGYGIVSECVANGVAMMYTSRGVFAEYEVMVADMPRMLRCRYIAQDDLMAGRWSETIHALLAQPAPPERPAINGAEVAADAILKSTVD
jgi:L-arabinokinase